MSNPDVTLHGIEDHVRATAEKVTGKFYCFNCRTNRPVEEKRKLKGSTRTQCSICIANKKPPRKMQ
jgi:hypothetical protein